MHQFRDACMHATKETFKKQGAILPSATLLAPTGIHPVIFNGPLSATTKSKISMFIHDAIRDLEATEMAFSMEAWTTNLALCKRCLGAGDLGCADCSKGPRKEALCLTWSTPKIEETWMAEVFRENGSVAAGEWAKQKIQPSSNSRFAHFFRKAWKAYN